MTHDHPQPGLLDEIRGYWAGHGPLWKLYWVYGVGLSTLGGAFILATVLQRALPVSVLVALLGVALLYTGFILVSIWRSAFNIASDPLGIDREAWGWIARVLTFGWALNAGGGALMLLQYTLNY
ncbi:MAG: Positive regulator of sigma(E), RseC/MucC [Rhodobacteraceae bacterium HLUCCA12]|nr:MAG: Positive regulator of sigma(E), RseC/MucC [Rhodobacteraceae bacterium HLUCCA12]